jgi:hypothetical protein
MESDQAEPATSPEEKIEARRENLLKGLSPATRAQLRGKATLTKSSDETLLDDLSPATRAALEPGAMSDDVVAAAEQDSGYHLLVCPEGDHPYRLDFETPEGLVQRMQRLDGEDIYVIPFYGHVFPFTQAPDRLLLLPGGEAIAIREQQFRIPSLPEGLQDHEIEETGYLGPPELAVVDPEYLKPVGFEATPED